MPALRIATQPDLTMPMNIGCRERQAADPNGPTTTCRRHCRSNAPARPADRAIPADNPRRCRHPSQVGDSVLLAMVRNMRCWLSPFQPSAVNANAACSIDRQRNARRPWMPEFVRVDEL